MNASTIQSNLRNRLIAIAVAVALIAGAVMAYPVFSDEAGAHGASSLQELPQIADPVWGPGGGGNG